MLQVNLHSADFSRSTQFSHVYTALSWNSNNTSSKMLLMLLDTFVLYSVQVRWCSHQCWWNVIGFHGMLSRIITLQKAMVALLWEQNCIWFVITILMQIRLRIYSLIRIRQPALFWTRTRMKTLTRPSAWSLIGYRRFSSATFERHGCAKQISLTTRWK